MPSHIALLRGINVGGKLVSMPELREAVSSLGHRDVATYIRSGNVVFSTDETDTAALAAGMERAIAERLGVRAGVVVLSRDDLAQVTRDNPFTAEPNPKFVHVVFLPGDPEPGHAEHLAAAEQKAAAKGSRDRVRLVGRAVFIHTPDGFGRSELAALLSRAGGPMSARAGGTARNWSTVTKLLAMCGAGG